MSDETTMDAEVIADFQKHIATSDYRTGQEEEIIMISATLSEIVGFALASHRTGRALTAERDAARAELARLKSLLRGVPEALAGYADMARGFLKDPTSTGYGDPSLGLTAAILEAKAAAIRAALDAPEKE